MLVYQRVNGFQWGITQHQKTVPEPPGTAQIAESAKEMEEKPPAMRASVLSGGGHVILKKEDLPSDLWLWLT